MGVNITQPAFLDIHGGTVENDQYISPGIIFLATRSFDQVLNGPGKDNVYKEKKYREK